MSVICKTWHLSSLSSGMLSSSIELALRSLVLNLRVVFFILLFSRCRGQTRKAGHLVADDELPRVALRRARLPTAKSTPASRRCLPAPLCPS